MWAADRSVSVPMALIDLDRRDATGQIFRRISLIMFLPFDVERPNSARASHMDDERIYRRSATPLPQGGGGGAPAPRIFEVPFYLCTHRLTQNYQHVGRPGLVCRRSVTPPPERGGVTALPNLLGIYLDILYMRTPFVAELPNLTW